MRNARFLAVLLIVVVGCTTEIPVRTQITIDAPRSAVFSVLADFENYGAWNPYHIRVVGQPVVGSALEMRVRRPDGKVIDVPHVRVLRLVPNDELTWGGGIAGIFRGEHVFRLEDTDNGGTRLIHNEDFNGLFVGFADLPANVLTDGYIRMNEALKTYVEARRVQSHVDRHLADLPSK